jgi:adenosylhomocysteine nucleosidase
MPLGVIVGLEAEARLARRWGLPVAVGGGDAAGAARAAEALAPQVRAFISFGLAGGLDPALRAGALLVPDRVVDGGEAWAADPALQAALGGGTGHVLLGGGAILATAAAKRAAWIAGAHAVDLESAAVARVAAATGKTFAVLRAVCDEAGRDLPAAALLALDAAGRIGAARVGLAVLRRPWQLPALLGLARDAARARAALAGRVRATTPDLAGRVRATTPGLAGRVRATPGLAGRVRATPGLAGRVRATPGLNGSV